MSLPGTQPESGPMRLFITGDLRLSRRASWAAGVIKDALGPFTDRSVALDMHMFSRAQSLSSTGVRGREKREQDRVMVRRIPQDDESLLVVGGDRLGVSEAVAYVLGRAVASEAVEEVFYLGSARTLGRLGSLAGNEITVISNPLQVYQWPAATREVAGAEAII